jgi:hypothetical protein
VSLVEVGLWLGLFDGEEGLGLAFSYYFCGGLRSSWCSLRRVRMLPA